VQTQPVGADAFGLDVYGLDRQVNFYTIAFVAVLSLQGCH